jgi:alpha-methylacyl-CoA racemase
MATTGALAGLKVLDLTRLLPGPLCTHFLTRLGARVIKVEGIEGTGDQLGDYTRQLVPPLFETLNAGKQGIAIIWRVEHGQATLRRLAQQVDVLVEGNRPGAMQRLGLDYDSLKKVNDKLIYCSISGYGATGPYAKRAGHDLNYQSLSGMLGISGKDGEVPPLTGFQPADGAGAMHAAMGIMAAVIGRYNTGRGQFVDISLTESTLSLGVASLSAGLAGYEAPRGTGSLDGGLPSYNIYATKDNKYLAVGALEPHFWLRIKEVFKSLPEGDGKFETTADVAKMFASKDQDEWLRIFANSDVCLEPVMSPKEVFQHPQHVERKVFQSGDMSNPLPHMVLGPRLSDNPVQRLKKAPQLGQHTADLLKEFGFTDSEITSLESSKSVYGAPLPLCAQNKPYRVKLEAGKEYWWCACGKSSTQPFCDGSHKGSGYAPVKVVAEEDGVFPFCGCKLSKKGPRCDGSHKPPK